MLGRNISESKDVIVINLTPDTPEDIAQQILHLMYSHEVAVFQNREYLREVPSEDLPILPSDGYFWYRNGNEWTVRKYYTAPEVIIDLDVYIRDGIFAGYNLSINKNLVDTYLQTAPRPSSGERKSTYGGFSSGDFKNIATDHSTTRGHGIAYVDSLTGFNKNNASIYSDDNPRNYSPEDSSGPQARGSDYGKNIRNHQLEAKARKQSGAYREVNVFQIHSQQVRCGLFIPHEKHAICLLPNEISYAKFPQGIRYQAKNGIRMNDLWNNYQQPLEHKPRARVLDITTQTIPTRTYSLQSLNIKYGYFLFKKIPLQFDSEEQFEIGKPYYFDDDSEMRFILTKQKNSTNFTYTYYEYSRILSLPISVILGIGSLCDLICQEWDEVNQGYQSRFLPLYEQLRQLETQLIAAQEYIHQNKDMLQRIFDGYKNNEIRREDAREFITVIRKHINLLKSYHYQSKKIIQTYLCSRNGIISNILREIPLSLRDIFQNKNYLFYNSLAYICDTFKADEQELLNKLLELIQKMEYHLSSLKAILSQPDILLSSVPVDSTSHIVTRKRKREEIDLPESFKSDSEDRDHNTGSTVILSFEKDKILEDSSERTLPSSSLTVLSARSYSTSSSLISIKKEDEPDNKADLEQTSSVISFVQENRVPWNQTFFVATKAESKYEQAKLYSYDEILERATQAVKKLTDLRDSNARDYAERLKKINNPGGINKVNIDSIAQWVDRMENEIRTKLSEAHPSEQRRSSFG